MPARTLLETIADAIVEAQKVRAYGLYDYSRYPGGRPPHVIRYETGDRYNEIVTRFNEPEPARLLYERLCREYVASRVIKAFEDWMVADLIERMADFQMRRR